MGQIIRESNQITNGVFQMKSRINKLVSSRSKEEYHAALREIEDMIPHAEYEIDSDRARFAAALRQTYVKKGKQDIVTNTDMAKMVDQRIQDMHELHDHIVKRNLLRDIRKARTEKDLDRASKLEEEFLKKYGRSNSRH